MEDGRWFLGLVVVVVVVVAGFRWEREEEEVACGMMKGAEGELELERTKKVRA